MSDLIRREDAIEALKKYQDLESNNFTDTDPVIMMTVATIANCIEEIVQIPSAEPEPEEFEWCSHGESPCKEYDQEKHCCHRWTKVIRQTVEELKEHEPERKKGEWISHENYDECSKCHCFTAVGFNFCPHCGADNRGE